MKQNILNIAVTATPETDGEALSAGTMYEHNATAVCFTLDADLVLPEYRYYVEFVTVSGTARTAYLTPDAQNRITVELPVEITAQMTVLCILNIVKIAENGKTEQVIKAKTVRLYFSNLENTDRLIDENHMFSVNQLLEAIRLGTFRGEQGVQGEQGEKGDKGDKGEPAVPVDATVTETSLNPVASSGVYSFVNGRTERQIASVEVGSGESVNNIQIKEDINGNAFRLRKICIYAMIKYEPNLDPITLRIRTNNGVRYLALIAPIPANGKLHFFHSAETAKGIVSVGQTIYGAEGQGIIENKQHQTISTYYTDAFSDIYVGLFDSATGKEAIPMLEGSKILITGIDDE